MIVIGADAHKRSHMLAAVDAGTGVLVAELEIRANDDGHRRGCGGRARWRPSGCGRSRTAVGSRASLEQALLGAGERVVRVPPR